MNTKEFATGIIVFSGFLFPISVASFLAFSLIFGFTSLFHFLKYSLVITIGGSFFLVSLLYFLDSIFIRIYKIKNPEQR